MSGFAAFLVELLAGLGSVRVKRMFGGAGVYIGDSPMMGLVAEDTLYLKADEALKAELKEAGSAPFMWTPSKGPRAGESIDMGYWRMPDDALDDAERACAWAKKALAVAQAKAAAKPRARRSQQRRRPRKKR